MLSIARVLKITFLYVIFVAGIVAAQPATTPMQQATPLEGKTVKTRHVLYSLVLPGAGEWATGNSRLGKIFMGSEITLWIAYLSSRGYINTLQQDLESFAAVNAGVNPAGKNEQYWIDIGSSISIYEFNAQQLLDRDLASRYSENSDFDWQWASEDQRRDYFQRRLNRQDWKRRSTVLVGGIILNHLISAVDVIRLLRKSNSTGDLQERQSFLHINHRRQYDGDDVYALNFTWRL